MDMLTYNTKFCKLAIYAPHLVPTKEARVQRFIDGLVGRLYTVVAPQMKTLSYSDVVDLARKIENKGRKERAASDLRKKSKIGGAFSGGFSENRRAGNQGQQQQGSQTGTHMSSQSTYRPYYRQVCQTCGRSHLGQCHILTRECFRCGQLGHHLRDCPQPPRNFNQASIQSAAPTQTTRNTSGATGTGNRGRGVGGHATVNQGQGNAGRVVTGILSVCSYDALALIDPGSTHSYVSSYFALRFSRQPELLNDPFLVATPVGESLLAEYVYRAFDYHEKIVKFEIPNEPSFILRGSQVPETCKIVSFMKAHRFLKKGCLGLLAIVNDTRKETASIENIPVVREFSDVFPKDLPGLPPVREIDLVLICYLKGSPYRYPHIELLEVKHLVFRHAYSE
uniref:Uncharacterized protein LOC104248285 n=1 Tax=Nicotiana sylvestris TaxID=4096 RepID=A0A1U7YUD3_NICSY|nr:PREDICTED: uncharacterized protein LOC104248285 [Nicotiana sylvestris]